MLKLELTSNLTQVLFIVVLTINTCVLSNSARAFDISPMEFASQMKLAIARVNNSLKHVQIEGLSKKIDLRKTLQDNKSLDQGSISGGKPRFYARSDQYELLNYSDGGDSNFNRIILLNGPNGFVLRKNDQKKFFIEHDEIPSNYIDFLNAEKSIIFEIVHNFFRIDLSNALDDPNFVIESVSEVTTENRKLQHVIFRMQETRQLRAGPQTFLVKGFFEVDPENSYAICNYRARRERTTANTPPYFVDGEGTIDYVPNSSTPQIRQAVTTEAMSHGQKTRSVFITKSWAYGPVPEREFTLEHYGLGDFTKPLAQGSSPLKTWSVVFAIVFLLLAVVFGWWSRRPRRPAVVS